MHRLLCLMTLTASLLAPTHATAQGGVDSPEAYERADALLELGKNQTDYWRKILDDGATAPRLVNALLYVQELSETEDIARIAKYVGDIDPIISETADDALRSFGREAIVAVDAIPEAKLDSIIRKELLEVLLQDHIERCCQRDLRLNPDRYAYKGRFDELFSISHDLEELMFELVKKSRSDIAEDMSGSRNSYNRYPSRTMPFMYYGGLVIAALGERNPEKLAVELKEVKDVEFQNQRYYYSRNLANATVETAIFFARQGETRLIEKLIGDMQKMFRTRNSADIPAVHIQIATLEYVAFGDTDMALDRIDESISKLPQSNSFITTRAYYLRARIMMSLGQEGSALENLEQGIESSSSACALLSVDDAFSGLKKERRFETIQAYVTLKTRRLSKSERPWQPDDDE
ncbi:hypothetical protein OAU50_00870 [Planctomycetota bacterium]|nr:hypothetical protein [Planctomycetota bacterium]